LLLRKRLFLSDLGSYLCISKRCEFRYFNLLFELSEPELLKPWAEVERPYLICCFIDVKCVIVRNVSLQLSLNVICHECHRYALSVLTVRV
jgi:hypothetical protein